MRNLKVILAGALAMGLVAGCSDSKNGNTGTSDGTVSVDADITASTTWTKDNVYTLRQLVFVGGGATLTIEPGTRIEGARGSALVVTTEGKIDAQGTAAEPIVFTSNQPTGTRTAGDWGGVVLLGKATINVSGGTNGIEGIPSSVAGTTYGGADDAHDCGKMKYVRIEFGGYKLGTDNELNGLTVGACGSATELDYIQVHLGKDDGIEFFGGTANLKHALITLPDDDGLDWDYGYSGKVQFLVVQQDANHGDKGFEADNNPAGDGAAPISNPTIYNVTLVGSNADPGAAYQKQAAMHLRRGTKGTIRNVIATGFSDFVVDVDGTLSAGYTAGATPELSVQNSLFFDNANVNDTNWPDQQTVYPAGTTTKIPNDCTNKDAALASDFSSCLDETATFTQAAWNNIFVDPQLTAAFNVTAPNFLLAAGSPALTGGATPPADGFFDATATFRGAFDATTDWTAGWTAFPAN